MSEERTRSGISRRSFLKTSAAAAGVAALGGTGMTALAANTDAGAGADEVKVYSGSCRGNCFQGCHINYKVREGRVVEAAAGEFPDSQYERICPKGHSLPHRFYDSHRVQYPMKRVAGTERGSGEFERISWDQALDEIAQKLTGYINTYGGRSIGFVSISGNSGLGENNMYSRLMNRIGAVILSLHVDNALFKGTIDTLGRHTAWNSNDMSDMKNSRTIFVWGSNVTEAQIQMWHWMIEAKQNGAKLVCVDPNVTGVSSKSDIHVRPRPGTDAAMTMGMMNVVLENGWEDLNFLRDHTVAPFLVKQDGTGAYLRAADAGIEVEGIADADIAAKTIMVAREDGTFDITANVTDPVLHGEFEVNGIKVKTAYDMLLERIAPYTPAKAAEISGVPEEQIREITDLYTNHGPSWIFQGLGPEHYVNGHTMYVANATLAMLTGNLAKPGASCGYVRPRDGWKGSTMTTKAGAGWPGTLRISAELLPEIMETGIYGEYEIPLHCIWVFNNNWLGVCCERKAYIDAFNKVETIIVADPCMSETAMYADYILPASDWAEEWDVHGNATLYPCIHIDRKSVV